MPTSAKHVFGAAIARLRHYVALSCDQLGQETVNLMRASADRSHHLLADDQARRDTARQQLDLVKQAYAEKQC